MKVNVKQCISTVGGAGVNFLAAQYAQIANLNLKIKYAPSKNEYQVFTFHNNLDDNSPLEPLTETVDLLKSHTANTRLNQLYDITYDNFLFVDSSEEHAFVHCLMELKHLTAILPRDYYRISKFLRHVIKYPDIKERLVGIQNLGKTELPVPRHSILEYISALNNPQDPLEGLYKFIDNAVNHTFDYTSTISNIQSYCPHAVIWDYRDLYFRLQFPDDPIWSQLDKQVVKDYSHKNLSFMYDYLDAFPPNVSDIMHDQIIEYGQDLKNA